MNDMTPNELVTIDQANALTVFTTPGHIDPILAKVRAAIDAFKPDTSTASGRKAIASIAYKVAQSKTYLDAEGKKLADQQKEIPKKIDATRKAIRDTLDKWKDEVRKPLTDWETAEDNRVASHKAAIAHIEACGNGMIGNEPQPFGVLFRELESKIVVGAQFEEFEAEAHRAKEQALAKLKAAFAEHEKREAEAAELARLRAEAASREQADREARIAKEAADRARKEAEDRAAADKKASEDAARREREAAERRELELKLQAEQAERRAAEAEAKAKREAESKAAAEAAELARREADKKHRANINRAALAALVDGGIDEQMARRVVLMIVMKKVPHVSINY